MKGFLLALALILSGVANAAAPEPTSFGTINEAAVKAAEMMYGISHYYEIGGVITVLGNGRFAIGVPQTDWSGRSVEINYDPDQFHGVIVGDYHMHPCNTHNFIPESFSPADLKEYRVYHVEGFMLDACTGKVHAFMPGQDKRNPDSETTEGRIIGKIPVDGKVTDTKYFIISSDF